MLTYSAFGQGLRSEISLPELGAGGAGEATWTIRRQTEAPPAIPAASTVGAERIYDDVYASLSRHPAGWRITVDDTGTFDWDAAARSITCWRRPDGTEDFLRAHLLGRVLGTVLHDDGYLVLHGSAVLTPAGVIGLLGPKGYGKSSLALALARAGAPLLTDDTLVIDVARPNARTSERPLALPGVTSTRLLPDSAAALGVQVGQDERADGKRAGSLGGDIPLATQSAPLAAIYLLLPASSIEDDHVAATARLPATSALAALTANSKVGEMLGPQAGGELLRRAATLLRRVPVRGLVITRDLARLPEAAATVLSWHQELPAPPAPPVPPVPA